MSAASPQPSDHDPVSTGSASGGSVTNRGVLVQTLVALLDVMVPEGDSVEPPFDTLTLEPKEGGDQFDFTWTKGDKTEATQVKSSFNSFELSDIRDWAKKMAKEQKNEICSLMLVGPMDAKVRGLREHEGVKISHIDADFRSPTALDALIHRASHLLAKLFDSHLKELRHCTAKQREGMIHSLDGWLISKAVYAKPMTFDQVCNFLRDGLNVKPPSQSLSAKLQPEEYVKKVLEVFEPQERQVKSLLEKHTALRDALVQRFEIGAPPSSQPSKDLIIAFHSDFCAALAKFSLIYEEDGVDAEAILEIIGIVLHLAMCPGLAAGLRSKKSAMSFEVSTEARQGITEMLLAWTRHKGVRPVPIKHLTEEKAPELFETHPFNTKTAIKHKVMDRLKISHDNDKELINVLSWNKDRGYPEYQSVAAQTEEDRRLIAEIQADPVLSHLLLLEQNKVFTVRPDAPLDRQLEFNLRKLLHLLRPS